MAEVCVEIDLDTLSTEELVYEFSKRSRANDIKDLSLEGLIDLLEIAKCPEEILWPLREYVSSKCITKYELDKWTEWAQQGGLSNA